MNLHNLYLDQRLPSRNLNLRVGRFDRYDPSGAWTLDRISLQWKRNGGTLEVYGGAPRRVELYYAPGREDEDADGPEGEYLAGVMLSRVLDEASGTGLRNAHWGCAGTAPAITPGGWMDTSAARGNLPLKHHR